MLSPNRNGYIVQVAVVEAGPVDVQNGIVPFHAVRYGDADKEDEGNAEGNPIAVLSIRRQAVERVVTADMMIVILDDNFYNFSPPWRPFLAASSNRYFLSTLSRITVTESLF